MNTKRRAELFVLNEQMRGNKALQRMISDLVFEYSAKESLERELTIKRLEIDRTNQLCQEKMAKQQQILMETAMFIFNLNSHQINDPTRQNGGFDDIFMEDEPEQRNRSQMRSTLQELKRILNFIYCTDNVQGFSEEQLEQIDRYLTAAN